METAGCWQPQCLTSLVQTARLWFRKKTCLKVMRVPPKSTFSHVYVCYSPHPHNQSCNILIIINIQMGTCVYLTNFLYTWSWLNKQYLFTLQTLLWQAWLLTHLGYFIHSGSRTIIFCVSVAVHHVRLLNMLNILVIGLYNSKYCLITISSIFNLKFWFMC